MGAAGPLSAALEALCAAPARRAEMGRAARLHCVANFSRDAVVGQMLEYYKRILGRSPYPAPV
ncbi:hypothetical protein FTUN_5640 [Frigoriglobus tundricola]|uniref:Uncharacterized protein n=1 Tax=Frigoriglobus tundricola TaxID=2774151 RepID=A0A6M5YX35_9BACT|nr:hypothetical protein FTUN_5640 [Frigoriglobus tundricola]